MQSSPCPLAVSWVVVYFQTYSKFDQLFQIRKIFYWFPLLFRARDSSVEQFTVSFQGTFVTVEPRVVAEDQDTMKVPIVYRLLGNSTIAGLGGSVGCAVGLETRRSRVQPPPRSATFSRGDWSWNIFYGHSLPSADSRRAVVSFWWKNVRNTG